jgi:hypothetical protein
VKDEIPKLSFLNKQGVPEYTQKKIPSILDKDAKHHLPPGSELTMWAHGVIQVTLESLPRARHDYAGIVAGWDNEDMDTLYAAAMQSQIINHPEKPYWEITGDVATKDAIIEQRINIRDFLKNYFNSPKNLNRGRIIVNANDSPYLVSALIFRSQSDCFNINLADWERLTLTPVPETMSNKYSTYHRDVTTGMKEINAGLKENKTILRWCAIWRLARVKPGQINLALLELVDGLHPDLWDARKHTVGNEKSLRDGIHQCDLCTGYLRH